MHARRCRNHFNMVAERDPQERIQQRIVEESVDEFRRFSRTQSDSAANLKLISFALSGKSVDISKIISMMDEMVILRERTRERVVEEIIGIPIAQVMEEAVEVAKPNPTGQGAELHSGRKPWPR